MESHADYDEQSEVLLFFNEDPEEIPPQVQDPTSPLQPQPNPLPTPSQPAPSATTNISADQSFWAEVYTLQPPHALMGILTDLHVHRFVLHQHLDSLNALTDTPIGHQPLTDTLPPPVQRLIAIYHNNVQRIQSHTRLALNAIDTMARFPPAAYFLDPNLTAQTSTSTHTETDHPPSSTSPLRFYPIPTATTRTTTLQDVATQTPPPSESILANPLPPLLMHESQQTTPRATPRAATHHRHIQTDIHAIVQLPSFCRPHTHSRQQPISNLPSHSQQYSSHSIPQSHISHQQTTTRSMAIRQPHPHTYCHFAGTAPHSTYISIPHRRHTTQQAFQDTSSYHYPHPHPPAGSTHRLPDPLQQRLRHQPPFYHYSPPASKATSTISLSSPTASFYHRTPSACPPGNWLAVPSRRILYASTLRGTTNSRSHAHAPMASTLFPSNTATHPIHPTTDWLLRLESTTPNGHAPPIHDLGGRAGAPPAAITTGL